MWGGGPGKMAEENVFSDYIEEKARCVCGEEVKNIIWFAKIVCSV